MRDLVPFVKFKKCGKHPWTSVALTCNFAKSNTPPWVFLTFFKIAQMLPNPAKRHICKFTS